MLSLDAIVYHPEGYSNSDRGNFSIFLHGNLQPNQRDINLLVRKKKSFIFWYARSKFEFLLVYTLVGCLGKHVSELNLIS